MKKYITTVLCICTALVSQAQIPLTRFGAPATRKMVSEGGLFKEFHSIEKPGVVGPLPSLSSQITDFEGLPDGLSNLLGIDALNITRAERQILEEQGPIDWEIPDAYFHYNSNGANDFQREDLFSKGMTFLDELTYEINQPIQYEAPLRTPLGKLTKYKELAKQVSQLQTEINNFLKSERSSLIRDEKLPPLYQKRHELVQQMKTELEKQINSAHLDIRGYYPAHDTVYLAKFDDIVKRLTAQAKRNAENEPSPLATLNPQERIEYATFRAHQIIDFQEGLRKYIRTMHPPVTSNMLRMDFVFSVYKWYYSTLAGHTIPVPEFYFKWQNRYKTICLPDDDPRLFALDFEKPGIGKHFKSSGWANRERKLLSLGSTTFARYAQTQEASQPEMSPAKEAPAPQATQGVYIPRANPSFEGLSSDQFAEIAEDTLEKTETFAENIRFGDEYKVYEGFRNNYTRIYQNGLSVVNQMAQEVKSLLEKGSTLSPVEAEVRLGKILETQTELRTFAAKILTSENAERMIYLDYILSHYRYLYATSAGIFATIHNIDYPYVSDNINDTLDRWRAWYRQKRKPMVSKQELNPRRSSEQPEEEH